jgi:hypothetical protein
MGSTAQSSSGQNIHTKVFLVTGATGAIGKAIARQLANIYSARSKYRFPVTLKYCKNTQTNYTPNGHIFGFEELKQTILSQ